MIAAIDTNVLIYAADRASARDKHEVAADLLNRLAVTRRGLLPLQALTEFYAVALAKGLIPIVPVFDQPVTNERHACEGRHPVVRRSI